MDFLVFFILWHGDHAKAFLISTFFSSLIIQKRIYSKFSKWFILWTPSVFNSTVFEKLNAISSVFLTFKCKPALATSFSKLIKSFWVCSIPSEIRATLSAKLRFVKMPGGTLLLFSYVKSKLFIPLDYLSHNIVCYYKREGCFTSFFSLQLHTHLS